jgi:3'-5' exoribonuclease
MAEEIDRTEQIEASLDFISKQIANIENEDLRGMCEWVVDQPLFALTSGSASPKNHHCYDGGLAVHTSEVLENALLMAEAQQYKVNKDVIIAAVVWHDFGKIYDYSRERDKDGNYNRNSHYFLVRHLSRSYAEFMISATINGLNEQLKEQVAHCILSHHGRKEWGSPVEPITPEAFIVHAADHISAQCAQNYYVRN